MEATLKDIRGSDWLAGFTVAALVLVTASAAMASAWLSRRADAPIIDPGLGAPIRVRPVVDAPIASEPAAAPAQLPEAWLQQDEAPPAAAPAVKPKRPRRVRKARNTHAPAEPAQTEPSEPAPAEPAPAEPAPVEAASADAAPGAVDPDASNDLSLEPDGTAPSGADLLGERLVAAYRDRLRRWLAARFRVRGSGLARETLLRHRVRATIELDDEGAVRAYVVTPSGLAVFDEAARVALESVRGDRVPAPPEGYPGALQRRIQITFVCGESTCD
ncbi:MAG: energy transducer TonB [Nannocystaceae bacterium]|nr:energy transducer TonB [Myxococcales bacterium]